MSSAHSSIEKSVADLNLAALTAQSDYHPSPAAWEDEVLYFLMLDRFSDGNEKGYIDHKGVPVNSGTTPMYQPGDKENAVKPPADPKKWRDAGKNWTHGTLKGLESKLGYLQRLGVTAVWISPLFKQVAKGDTYHGYGVQNFLDVDPNFGTREELKKLVKAAHKMNIRVILDIILNHAGDVFAYDADRYPEVDDKGNSYMDPRWDTKKYKAAGFRKDARDNGSLPFEPGADHPVGWPDGAVWPAELQQPGSFTSMGRISNWGYEPEYRSGDFWGLKDIYLGEGDVGNFRPSHALRALCDAYKFWIAYADLDGYRVDTVKHMEPGAARYMTAVLHEFAESIGKHNFYLIGEIVGKQNKVVDDIQTLGLDAALGINASMPRMEGMVKGDVNAEEFFGLFANSSDLGQASHTWFRDRVVTMFDDHDQVGHDDKTRFCAPGALGVPSPNPDYAKLLPAALALNLTTLGIPCIYYGSEQGFDGQGFKSGEGFEDRYIRECMFGGPFGAFRSKDRHFFDEDHPVYKAMKEVAGLRAGHPALRRGRQYLRQISGDAVNFGYPHKMGNAPMRSVVPWSRILYDREYLLAINTDPHEERTAWVVVDANLNPPGNHLSCVHSSAAGVAGTVEVVKSTPGGGSMVQLTVPPAGFVIYMQP